MDNRTIEQIEIYTISGQKVLSIRNVNEGGFINVNDFKPGIYFIKAITGEKKHLIKFIKK